MKFKDNVATGGGENYLKLKSGDSIKGIFRGDPHDYYMHWVGEEEGQRTSVECAAGNCIHCAKGNKKKFRFRVNFVLKENGKYVARIFEQGPRLYNNLRELAKAGYDLEKTVVVLGRQVSGFNDTTYTVLPDPISKVDKTLDMELQLIKLNDLANPVDDSGSVSSTDDSDVPF